MPVYKEEAIVIRRGNLGESDRLVTLFCRGRGKVAAVAKGARKPGSRFAGRLEPFTHVRVLLAVGRTLDVVSQVDVLEAFPALRGALDRLGHAAFVAELVDRALPDREPAPELFSTLRVALDLLARQDPELTAMWFAVRLLVLSGYAPIVGRCQVCGRAVEQGGALSFALGGTLCDADRHRDPDAVDASPVALRAIRYLLEAPAGTLTRLTLDRPRRAEVGGLLQRYLEYRLETKLKSPPVIKKMTAAHGKDK